MKQLLALAVGLAGFAAAVQAQERMPAPEPPVVLPVVQPPLIETPAAGTDEKFRKNLLSNIRFGNGIRSKSVKSIRRQKAFCSRPVVFRGAGTGQMHPM